MALEMVDLSIPVSLAACPSERCMRVALLVSGLLIVVRPIASKRRYNHDEGNNARKIFILCVAEGGCLSLQARLHATAAVSASPEALQPSKGAMWWQGGDGQMPHLI